MKIQTKQMSIKAMKQALAALENVWSNGLEELTTAPMECLRQAIADAEKHITKANGENK